MCTTCLILGCEVKKKWRNMRDTYSKHLKANKLQKDQRVRKNYKNWKWAPLMEVFKPFMPLAEIDNNYEDEFIDCDGTARSLPSDSAVDSEEDDTCLHSQSTDAIDIEDIKIENSDALLPPTSQKSPSYATNQSEKRSLSPDTVADYLKKKRKPYQELSPTELIFLGYAQTIETFSPKRQAITKLKIAQIVMEQELLHHEESLTPNNLNQGRSPFAEVDSHPEFALGT